MADRTPLIAGNWKMFKDCFEAVETAIELANLAVNVKDTDIMIAPTFTSLDLVYNEIKNSHIKLGAQNLFWEDEGAYTGEISASMLLSTGCSYVIIGHSERRQYFNETDETVNKKLKKAIQAELIPVLCIGETEKQRDANETFLVLDKQIEDGLKEIEAKDLNTLVLAYEPIWAIGTGKTATSTQAQEVHNYLRQKIQKKFGDELANSMRILYGGSVKPANISELMSMNDIDGALVGGASLNAETFYQIINYK